MNNPGTPGLRLLSLDGGGIRGLSMLIILEDLMWKLKVAEDLPDVPRPCNYFDLIGGTSTGGLIALMLGCLRMSVKDAMKAYGELSKEVFSDVKSQGSDGRFKASKLEKAIKGIVGAHSASQDPEEGMEDTRENPCKTSVQRILFFVCAMNAANMSLPVLFRTYNTTNNPAMDCTIWQAARATSAAPTFFKQIQIGLPGIEEAFVDGGMGQNNPIAALLLEAQVVFPDPQIACIIGLGTGQPHTIKIPTPSLLKRLFPLDVVEAIKGIATDCEKEHQRFARHFDPVPHVYFRFNVERGMQDIQLNQWERLGDVRANTRQYLLSHPIQNQLADAVKSLVEKIGRVSTQRLSKIPLHVGAGAVPTAVESQQFNLALALVRCPPPSQIFQGRQDILAKMDEYFSKDIGERHTYVLHGLGGSGKTEIALKFLDTANRHQPPRFTKQFFINASSLQTLDTALKNIAISHKIGKNSEDGLLWLISQREEWMLLFDNADNPSIDIFPFFPKCTHGNIIVTSRNPQLAVHGPRSHSKVGDMDETDAIDLLLLSAVKEKSIESTQSASEIIKELSCLPLAIIQAGAYISKFDCLHRYLSLYRHNRAKLLSQHSAQSHDDYEWTVYTTWQISFGQLSKPAASIPETIFEQAAESAIYSDEQEAQTLQEARRFLQNFLSVSGTWDPQQFMDIVAEIRGYSLIDRHDISDTLSIHPLVHSWCRHTLDDEPIARKCMTDILGMSIRLTEDAYLSRIGLISHIDSLIQDQTNIKSVFQEEYARVYFDSGRFREAESLEVMVLEKWKQLLGADHPDTLFAMEIWPPHTVNLEDHPDTLRAMANLATTYHKLGRYQEAEPLASTVLEKQKQLLGADHPHTLLAMGNLAVTYHKLGRYQEAEPLESMCWRSGSRYQEAEPLESIVLEKRKQLLGADHPDTLSAMANLAATYRNLGRSKRQSHLKALCWKAEAAAWCRPSRHAVQEAEPLESIVLEKRKQVLGADHPDTLSAMANLAATYRELGRYQEAESLEGIVLEKRKQVLGADHPNTLLAMENLAATYHELGRYKEAEDLEAQHDELVGYDSGDSEA
ncbi:acyl transferase/acyl hydrolase/lysophospholipase [Mycena leptocephala]|nr:acyl transferase/acyl hydrolase/lysophospholipase [Mycena leptocephala]